MLWTTFPLVYELYLLPPFNPLRLNKKFSKSFNADQEFFLKGFPFWFRFDYLIAKNPFK